MIRGPELRIVVERMLHDAQYAQERAARAMDACCRMVEARTRAIAAFPMLTTGRVT